jgi:hypothetical protein
MKKILFCEKEPRSTSRSLALAALLKEKKCVVASDKTLLEDLLKLWDKKTHWGSKAYLEMVAFNEKK